MFRKVVLLAVFLLIMSLASIHAQDAWVARDGAGKNSELIDAVFSRDALYIATKSVLYKAKDIKERWEGIFSLPKGGSNEITCLAGRGKILFVGTKKGLFRSDDYGASWKDIFRTILPGKNNITDIELSRYYKTRVLIATEKGVFLSDDLGGRWEDISGVLKNTFVKCVALNKDSAYAGTESGLYIKKPNSEDWERIFIRSAIEKNEAEEQEEPIADDTEKDTSIRSIAVNSNRVYVCYGSEIIYSDNEGNEWKSFSCEGLKGSINYILISPKNKKIYCATEKSVFEFNDERSLWVELYKGMSKNVNSNSLIFGSDDEKLILAATDKGLYSFQGGDYMLDKYPDIEKSMNTLKAAFDGEPTYKELREAAIRFCDVSPEKIKTWQRDSRIKAIVPKVTLGIDKHQSTNSEIYTSASSNYVSVGPDNFYNSISASVSWDLGNLLYSDDQTNIDVRSRLTTQLRNDILDDLRRAYYERKRLQFELMTNPPKDANIRFEKELRLQELTHSIDDLTGNYLSDHLRKK